MPLTMDDLYNAMIVSGTTPDIAETILCEIQACDPDIHTLIYPESQYKDGFEIVRMHHINFKYRTGVIYSVECTVYKCLEDEETEALEF